MHRYEPQWPMDGSDWDMPSVADFTFRCAEDIARFASLDGMATWSNRPDVWHLDQEGRWTCCSKGSSFDSVRTFAERPRDMVACRETTLGWACPQNWVVLEPRHRWLHGDDYDVTEADAAAFLALRKGLGRFGVSLLDVVVFSEEFQWWSLHELTSGTTTWSFAAPLSRRRRTAG